MDPIEVIGFETWYYDCHTKLYFRIRKQWLKCHEKMH